MRHEMIKLELDYFKCNGCGRHKYGIRDILQIPRRYRKIKLGCSRCRSHTKVELFSSEYGVYWQSCHNTDLFSPINYYLNNVT